MAAGKGRYTGEMTIEPGTGESEFKTSTTLRSVKDGTTMTRTGTSLVYSGYAWRGRSKSAAVPANAAPDDARREVREVMWVSPDQTYADGRWFWGFDQEFGFDVHMSSAPRALPCCSPPTILELRRDRKACGCAFWATRCRPS